MNGLFAFIEQMEAHSQEAKALVIPLLENLDSELPWTSSNFWALYQMRHQHDPVIQQALEHLRQYAIPLLEYEEQLADLDLETFTEKMAQIEQRFWEECYTQARVLSSETEASLFLCNAHTLHESDVRGLVKQNLWDVEAISTMLRVPTNCPTCKRGIQRIVLEELKQAKALKTLA
ncbi:(2Fe-2S)-binding protein [Meiothermus cerbereus]|uniref:(2Fe-2S)-binding protein n=1 Tax=Meiothermus cerbereus TaxID=65552 RepID=UPI003EE88CE4